jgi:hypothetical protein
LPCVWRRPAAAISHDFIRAPPGRGGGRVNAVRRAVRSTGIRAASAELASFHLSRCASIRRDDSRPKLGVSGCLGGHHVRIPPRLVVCGATPRRWYAGGREPLRRFQSGHRPQLGIADCSRK